MTEMPAPGAPDDELDGQAPDEDTAEKDDGAADDGDAAAEGERDTAAERTSPEVAALRREAARFRRRLREAEAERDTLAARVGVAHRGEAERLAAAVLVEPADLWRGDGVDLAGLLGDGGDVDAAAVERAARAVAAAHPHWARTFHAAHDGGARLGPPAWPERRDPLSDAVRRAAGGA